MIVETEKLITITNYAKRKKLSRQHVYRLANNNELTMILVDDIAFILLDDKAENFIRKKKVKRRKQNDKN